MNYFKINGTDFSLFVNELKVNKVHNYNSQTNAEGNAVVDYINSKRQIEVGIIPLDDADATTLLNAVDAFNVSVGFRNPLTNDIETINCVIPDTNVEYYTIQENKVMYKAFTLKFIEL